MRTSLNEVRQHETFISNEMEPGEALVYRAQLLINPRMRLDLSLQKKLYAIIRQYGRNQLRQEIEQVHNELFGHPKHRPFRERIARIFRSE